MKTMKYIQIVLMLTVMLAIVSIPATASTVQGWVFRSDTSAAMSGIVISNSSNTSQNATTSVNGSFNITVTATTTEIALSVAPTAGYTRNTSVKYTVAADATHNGSRNITMMVITPAVSAVTETTPTMSADTVSWTVTATDGLNNNYVGSRIKYGTDSALASNYFITDWTNSTAAPSITLTNLRINTDYYYQVETYNQLNSAYSATTTGDFKTKSGTSSHYTPVPTYTVVQSPTPFLGNLPGGSNGMVILIIIAVLAYFVLFGMGNNGGKKRR